MKYVADTNILLRWSQAGTPECVLARDAVARLWRDGQTVSITPQNLVEFWSVATRPSSANGLGLTPEEANHAALDLESLFPLLPDSPAIHTLWRRLVVDAGLSGVNVHDARLAAALRTNEVDRLLTLNVRHYSRFGVIAVNPADVLTTAS